MAIPRIDATTTRDDTSSDATAVRLEGVTRVFGLTPALVRVDLAVARGETLVVRGPNGAGKTTLLRVIATALSPTYGRGRVLGHDLGRGREEIRRRTEVLGHRTRLYEDLTAEENLRFACALYGVSPARTAPALEHVGLSSVADHRVSSFSQGMRQRVALARVILRAPDLLLLDDPYAGLDAEGRHILDALLADARTEGQTVILATHEAAAGALATRTVRMEAGRVLA